METERCIICGVSNDIDCFLDEDPTKPCGRCMEIYEEVKGYLDSCDKTTEVSKGLTDLTVEEAREAGLNAGKALKRLH